MTDVKEFRLIVTCATLGPNDDVAKAIKEKGWRIIKRMEHTGDIVVTAKGELETLIKEAKSIPRVVETEVDVRHAIS